MKNRPDGRSTSRTNPDVPPEYSPKGHQRFISDSWKVIVPVDKRPKQMNNFNLKNMFSVTLRDTGEVADRRRHQEIRSIVKTGYAVHIPPVGLRPLRP